MLCLWDREPVLKAIKIKKRNKYILSLLFKCTMCQGTLGHTAPCSTVIKCQNQQDKNQCPEASIQPYSLQSPSAASSLHALSIIAVPRW